MTKTWNGQYVKDTVNLGTPDEEAFTALLGLALRKNPKRAHLLVSTVLGKHIPQHPNTIRYASGYLGEKILVAENMQPSTHRNLERLIQALQTEDATLTNPISTHSDSEHFVVFGYAETATSLGACVAEALKASYIHSTRYPEPGRLNYGSFEEEHSHATSHYITPPSEEFFSGKTIVLVDDELTTGQTIINTISMFEQQEHHPVYYVATLTDLRDRKSREKFAEFEQASGIKIKVFSLVDSRVDIPEGVVDQAYHVIARLKTHAEEVGSDKAVIVQKQIAFTLPELKNGVTYDNLQQFTVEAEKVAGLISVEATENVLVLGNEEDTFFPLLVSDALQRTTEAKVYSSSTTRSPVVSYDNAEYAIKTRVKYKISGPDGLEKRFAYNIEPGKFDHVVLIGTAAELDTLHVLISKLRQLTTRITLIERTF